MINVFLCDDEPTLLKNYSEIVTNFAQSHPNTTEITLKTKNGYELLVFLKESHFQGGLYFLDIDLANDQLNGIDLALEIRKLDSYAQIAFISTHEELLKETIQRRINILNFIYKEDGLESVRAMIQETLMTAIELHDKQLPEQEGAAYFEYNNGLILEKIKLDEINYFETAQQVRHILVHADSSVIEFSAKMIDIEKQLPQFYKAHKSILINPEKVVKIDKLKRRVAFDNGDSCDISYRKVTGLMNLIATAQQD